MEWRKSESHQWGRVERDYEGERTMIGFDNECAMYGVRCTQRLIHVQFTTSQCTIEDALNGVKRVKKKKKMFMIVLKRNE